MPRLWSFIAGSGGTGTLIARANEQAIANGASTVSVTFSSDIGTVNYALTVTLRNDTDTDPIYLTAQITSQTSAGFTVLLSAPTDSTNYVLSYMAAAFV